MDVEHHETQHVANVIMLERRRQIEEEGYDRPHDDCRDWRELAKAATCYLLSAIDRAHDVMIGRNPLWPWEPHVFKPKTPWRDMTRAGALLLAAMERFLRQAIDRHLT